MFIDIIVGARPNFVKAFPLITYLLKFKKIKFRLIHTGQHYDKQMSKNFFNEFNFNKHIEFLGTSNKNPIQFISETINQYSKKIIRKKPDLCVLFGDVNSTLAIAIACNKMNVKIAHIEAGLRSYDKSMPEEHNRIITDHLSKFLFTTTSNAKKNLIKENIEKDNIYLVGNIMIEALIRSKNKLRNISYNINKYIVLTIHRPDNTNNKKKIDEYLKTIVSSIDDNVNIIFPVHHSVKKKINYKKYRSIKFIEPLSYFKFLALIKNSIGVITDSGGITEETTYLNIPCLTLRNNTERPETISSGTNILIGEDHKKLKFFIKKMIKNRWKKNKAISLWDKKVSERIVKIIYSKKNDLSSN